MLTDEDGNETEEYAKDPYGRELPCCEYDESEEGYWDSPLLDSSDKFPDADND